MAEAKGEGRSVITHRDTGDECDGTCCQEVEEIAVASDDAAREMLRGSNPHDHDLHRWADDGGPVFE